MSGDTTGSSIILLADRLQTVRRPEGVREVFLGVPHDVFTGAAVLKVVREFPRRIQWVVSLLLGDALTHKATGDETPSRRGVYAYLGPKLPRCLQESGGLPPKGGASWVSRGELPIGEQGIVGLVGHAVKNAARIGVHPIMVPENGATVSAVAIELRAAVKVCRVVYSE